MWKICWGDIVARCTEESMELDGREVTVPAMERRLLLFLLEHPDRDLSREELLREVWGYEMGGITRTVDTHVKNLRAHLGRLGRLISTVRGVGYRLDAIRNQAHLCFCCSCSGPKKMAS